MGVDLLSLDELKNTRYESVYARHPCDMVGVEEKAGEKEIK